MSEQAGIQLFENKKIRTAWDEEKEEWYFSVVDVVGVLTEQPMHLGARRYWGVLKTRLSQEMGQPTTICSQLKMKAEDGKMRLTDVATPSSFCVLSSPSPRKKPNRSNAGWRVWEKSVSMRSSIRN